MNQMGESMEKPVVPQENLEKDEELSEVFVEKIDDKYSIFQKGESKYIVNPDGKRISKEYDDFELCKRGSGKNEDTLLVGISGSTRSTKRLLKLSEDVEFFVELPTNFQEIEFDEDLGSVVCELGGKKYIVDVKTGDRIGSGHHELFKRDGKILGIVEIEEIDGSIRKRDTTYKETSKEDLVENKELKIMEEEFLDNLLGPEMKTGKIGKMKRKEVHQIKSRGSIEIFSEIRNVVKGYGGFGGLEEAIKQAINIPISPGWESAHREDILDGIVSALNSSLKGGEINSKEAQDFFREIVKKFAEISEIAGYSIDADYPWCRTMNLIGTNKKQKDANESS